jgi:hypothetical protein
MYRRACLPCLVLTTLAVTLGTGCSGNSSSGGTETANKAPAIQFDKIQGKVQIQEQPSSADAAMNAGGPAVFLWEGVRRYRLFFKSRTEVEPGKKYAAEGIWAQRFIDGLGDPDQGKNGYPLQSSCAKAIQSIWPGLAFDVTDGHISALHTAIKRYPARPVFLVNKFALLEGAAAAADKEEDLPEVAVPAAKQKELQTAGSVSLPAPLWAAEGGSASCKILIGKDGKVAELRTGAQLCEAVPWHEFAYQPPVRNGRPVTVTTEVEIGFEPKK